MTLPSTTLPAVVALSAAAAVALSPAVAAAQPPGAFDSVQHSLLLEERYRDYTAVLPTDYDETRAYPIILAFGGYGDSAASYREYANIEQAVDGEAIVVYAQAVNNAWAGAPYAVTTMDEDVDYVRAVVDDVVENYSGDPERVFATGMSNGGGFAAALSCHAPTLVDAVVAVAGAYYNESVTNCRFAQRVPTLLVHGAHDEMMSFGGGYRHGAAYLGVERTLKNLATRNGCVPDSLHERSADEGTTTFSADNCEVDTEILRVDDYGHTWFEDPEAERVAVDFFRRQA
ncbi:alpha/beta hydrolase family esterase [Corynebacterium guangdongense]|uniref:Polyhydroxybutyrate depolymerase n=1 Tax=Corynebacterium guangdongense TaxID=1783348 RepID=A0ABU1ZZP5_9CORY|nr:prolyl oligopeptidase family serine peptidase [Corynebacterium guangdongense]MDR7329863.1 polyhydroxybutyrate depolymerase [Corynebacterium guangdongense]WJZ18426.1 Alpha/beta hydrolase family protein [Corynebacterium guangdongense]